jgi:hypothetical protein
MYERKIMLEFSMTEKQSGIFRENELMPRMLR